MIGCFCIIGEVAAVSGLAWLGNKLRKRRAAKKKAA
jgi:hypothetical protein